jgi:Ca2+-binding RTX toxin-like protein
LYRRASLAAALAAGCVCALPASAVASAVAVTTSTPGAPPEVTFFAAGGERNDVRFDVADKTVTVSDASAGALQTGPGCRAQGAKRAVCTATVSFSAYAVTLADGNDRAVFVPVGQFSGADARVSAGAGNDVVNATALERTTQFQGGEGNDALIGSAGSDFLNGGAGSDTLIALAGNDQLAGDAAGTPVRDALDGGPGTDLADYGDHTQPIRIDLRNEFLQGADGENDSFKSIESVDATRGNDVLLGNGKGNTFTDVGGVDVMRGFGGRDLLRSLKPDSKPDSMSGGAGPDTLVASAGGTASGGAGDDELFGNRAVLSGGAGDDMFDELRGTASCGGGRDTVRISRGADAVVQRSCETVHYGDATLLLPIRRTQRGLEARIRCSSGEIGNDTCDGPFTVKLGRRLVARGNYTLAEGQRRTVRMEYRRGAKRALGKRRKLVRVTVGRYVFDTYV